MMPTNFNVPDPRETRLVLAPPDEGSVAPEVVQQFIAENRLPAWNAQQCIYELNRIPADKWPMISTFLSRICQEKFDGDIIQTLSHMPIDILTPAIHFATTWHITDGEALYALSTVKAEEFQAFTQLVEAYGLLQKPHIWRALAAMPAKYKDAFIRFCQTRQYDVNGFKGGLILQHHAPAQ